MQSEESRHRQSARDGKLTDRYWNQGRHQTSESHQQKCECARNHETFGVLYVIGASFPNVEIKGCFSRQFELHPRRTAPQLVLKRALQLVKRRDERLHGTLAVSESHQNKSSSSSA